MNKKRVFSVLLAVVMIMAAINLAPVLEVWATSAIGQGNASKGPGYHEWDNREGNWTGYSREQNSQGLQTGSLTYAEDGAYSSTVGTDSTADPNYRTRHVTMFNDCDPHYDDSANNGTWLWTPVYQVDYKATNKTFTDAGATWSQWDTNRDRRFVTTDYTDSSMTQYGITADSDKADYWQQYNEPGDDNPSFGPWLVEGYGCVPSYDKELDVFGEQNTYTVEQAKSWASSQNEGVSFYSHDKGDCDFRMAFRNFNNTDKTYFNPYKNTQKYSGADAGINIGEYDYLEFDLKITSQANWKKSRSGDPASTYCVFAYYESNCAAGEYCNNSTSCIEGWDHTKMDFTNQLSWNGDTYAKPDEWVTIRLAIPEKVKNWQNYNYAKPTVKQFTIRMIGGNAANKKCIYINDVRLVKNDDHIGKVLTHDNNGTALTDSKYTQYPSGEYYMINDFEFNDNKDEMYQTFANGSTAVSKTNSCQMGVQQPYSSTVANQLYPSMYRVYRPQEINLDDSEKRLDITSSSSWGAVGWGNKGNNVYACEQGVGVTQGDYATAITARSALYTQGTSTWKFPMYYERVYEEAMDLSKYTHFSIDVFIRTENAKGIQKNPDGINTKGVTFAIDLFNKDTRAALDTNDQFNYKNGHSVKFLMPYGKDCWEGDETQSGYGEILKLGDKYYKGEYTANGSMRFVFTREDLLEGQKGDGGAYTLNNINGMRFLWLNRVNDGDTSSQYYSVKNGSQLVAGNRVDIILDNFIAYNVDTSITVENKVSDTTYLDAGTNKADGQNFVYRLQGGYASDDDKCLTTNDLGGNEVDTITEKVDLTFTVPANGSATIRNLPFNSYYISQQSWAWRYGVDTITMKNGDGSTSNRLRKAGNTAVIMPQTNSQNKTDIWDMMKRRHFTVTFTQDYVKRDYGVDPNSKDNVPNDKADGYANKRWLDGSHTMNPVG